MLKTLEQLDRWIADRFRGWSRQISGGEHPLETLEIRKEILTAIRDRVEPLAGGKYMFPYTDVSVDLYAADSDQHARYEAAFIENDSLADEIREMLAELRSSVEVRVSASENPAVAVEGPYKLSFRRTGTAASPKASETKLRPSERPAATVVVVAGQANAEEFPVKSGYVRLGRMQEVMEAGAGLRRRNDIVFAENERSVSREHATIRFDAPAGVFRITDDNSSMGTVVFRDGRPIRVPKGEPHGVRLCDGDEIHLGSVRLRFELR